MEFDCPLLFFLALGVAVRMHSGAAPGDLHPGSIFFSCDSDLTGSRISLTGTSGWEGEPSAALELLLVRLPPAGHGRARAEWQLPCSPRSFRPDARPGERRRTARRDPRKLATRSLRAAQVGELGKEQMSVLHGRRGPDREDGAARIRRQGDPGRGLPGPVDSRFPQGPRTPAGHRDGAPHIERELSGLDGRPEIRAAFHKWSARMEEKGFTSASPMHGAGRRDLHGVASRSVEPVVLHGVGNPAADDRGGYEGAPGAARAAQHSGPDPWQLPRGPGLIVVRCR